MAGTFCASSITTTCGCAAFGMALQMPMSCSGWLRKLDHYPGSEKSSRSAGFGLSSLKSGDFPVWRAPNTICTNGVANFRCLPASA